MTARRAVATADVTTGETEAEMNPLHAQLEALFTPFSAGGRRNETVQMMTAHNGSPAERSLGSTLHSVAKPEPDADGHPRKRFFGLLFRFDSDWHYRLETGSGGDLVAFLLSKAEATTYKKWPSRIPPSPLVSTDIARFAAHPATGARATG
jgi:hypothetical protein